ncbi:MAG: SGNH/GDSL hydrolase family protein [Gammaproteobacteria bacterium]
MRVLRFSAFLIVSLLLSLTLSVGAYAGKPSKTSCGDGTCNGRETSATCPLDCSPPPSVCGDGNLDSGEQCDDGNTTNGDGCSSSCQNEETSTLVPANQFNAGDSIGEGEAADGTIGEAHHETVWSTGYASGDSVSSLNERFESLDVDGYYENTESRDPDFNMAVSGAEMADFDDQAVAIVASAKLIDGGAGQITVLLGSNDVCADTINDMTSSDDFGDQLAAGLAVLAANPSTQYAYIQVSSIPAIYWLWEAKRSDFWCRAFAWPFVPCQNLLANPRDDCRDSASRLNPDVIYSGDGSNCVRRKQFHARIRDVYNPILRDVVNCYNGTASDLNSCPPGSWGTLPNAYYVDIFDVRFTSSHVNGGDCFHPSEAGHALFAEEQWCRSWGEEDLVCSP